VARRLQLHDLLLTLAAHVYFQQPSNVQMAYPCILYMRDSADTEFADNKPYRYTQRYMVTVIDEDPDSVIPAKLAALPQCTYDRHYVADGLHHDVYHLYF